MRKPIIVLVLGALLSPPLTTFAQSPSAQEIKFKRQIVERGANQKVKVKLKSNEVLQGNIAEIRNDSFTLQRVDVVGQINNQDVAYSELSNVSKVGGKNSGNTFKRGFLMGVGVYLGMLAVGAVIIGIAAAASH